MAKIDRKLVYGKCNGKCAYCGSELNGKFQVDHIIPQRDFISYVIKNFKIPPFLSHLTPDDLNHIDNLLPACSVCNKWKSSHHLELFRSEISEQIKRLNNWSANYRFAKRYNLIQETPKRIVFYFETINQLNK